MKPAKALQQDLFSRKSGIGISEYHDFLTPFCRKTLIENPMDSPSAVRFQKTGGRSRRWPVQRPRPSFFRAVPPKSLPTFMKRTLSRTGKTAHFAEWAGPPRYPGNWPGVTPKSTMLQAMMMGRPSSWARLQNFIAFAAGIEPDFLRMNRLDGFQEGRADGRRQIHAHAVHRGHRQFLERRIRLDAFDFLRMRIDGIDFVALIQMCADRLVAELLAILAGSQNRHRGSSHAGPRR